MYSAEEITLATNNFSSANLIGTGAFGEVFHGIIRHTKVAVKVGTNKVSIDYVTIIDNNKYCLGC